MPTKTQALSNNAGLGLNGHPSGEQPSVTTIDDILPELATSLDANMSAKHDALFAPDPNEPKGRNPLKVAAVLLGLPLLAWIGWVSWQSYWTSWTENKTRLVISSIDEMKGYPVEIQCDTWRTRAGLVPV